MPRKYEIEGAFRAAVKIEQTGRLTVTTKILLNNWIECYVTTFKDISSDGGEARTFMLFNPNGRV